jgi:four helix bundle protein
MLDIYAVSLEVVRQLQPVIRAARAKDRNIADQLSRSATSVVANIAEGCAHRGAMRRHRYSVALGEARETATWLDIVEATRMATRPAGIDARMNHVIGVLVKLTR